MAQNQLGLVNGKWLIANCGKHPSEKNCKVVLMAPENQRDDLLDAVINHAVKCHGHTDNKDLRAQINNILELVSIE